MGGFLNHYKKKKTQKCTYIEKPNYSLNTFQQSSTKKFPFLTSTNSRILKFYLKLEADHKNFKPQTYKQQKIIITQQIGGLAFKTIKSQEKTVIYSNKQQRQILQENPTQGLQIQKAKDNCNVKDTKIPILQQRIFLFHPTPQNKIDHPSICHNKVSIFIMLKV